MEYDQRRFKKQEMDLTRSGEATKNEITKILDATHYTHHGFIVEYDDENNPLVTITFSACPDYQFVIASNLNVFTTRECPGIDVDAAETFQRSDFELCINAVKEWTYRIVERRKASILDEYGGEIG
jgi:hypothetical protein